MRHPAIIAAAWGFAWMAAHGAPLPEAAAAALPERAMRASSTSRFRVIGPWADANQELLLAAEDLADRLARALDRPLPVDRRRPFRFVVAAGNPTDPAAVRPRLQVSPDGVEQELFLANPERADPQQVSQATVALLLSRYLIALQPPDAWRERPAAPPAWFAAGLSRHLYPETRRADLRFCESAPSSPDLDSILAATNAVTDAQRPFCTALVTWLFAQSKPDEIRIRFFPVWARGAMGDLDDVVALVRIADPRQLQCRWDLWMVAQRGVWASDTFTPRELLEQLDAVLDAPTHLIPVEVPNDLPERLTPALLIDRRREGWTRRVAEDRLARIHALPAGACPDVQPLIEAFAAVLQPLANRPRLWGPGHATLIHRLERAEALRADCRRRLANPSGSPPPPSA